MPNSITSAHACPLARCQASARARYAQPDQRQRLRARAVGAHLHEFLDDKLVELKIGVLHRTGNERAVELVVEHLLGQRGTGVRLHPQFQRRMCGAHGLQRCGQVQRGESLHRADPQFPCALADLPHRCGRLAFEQQHPARVFEQHPPGRRELDPAPLAEKEFRSQLFLEPADAARDIRLYGVELARRSEDAALFDDGLESPQRDKFHHPSPKQNFSFRTNRLFR
ncbi:hypothetical protein ebA1381 [Aromatoleum aromaticum EbN1]|uniref:Uncharacterized protein n=1 Tax=Aromatoleum aromaticum (strain DSM 19018 / LMG 30748 / EbN1) TaxID=76114 RepID=Q5P738_AROAE|nr:hypothetical protein ebA1381 [Aromatoleum aromaticum EbN1]